MPDLFDLPQEELNMIKSIYSGKYKGNEWAGYYKAVEILNGNK